MSKRKVDIIKLSKEYREGKINQISIGKTKIEALTASLHAQAGFIDGYKCAIKSMHATIQSILDNAVHVGGTDYRISEDVINKIREVLK